MFKGSVVVPVHPCRAPLGGADKAGHVTAAGEKSSNFRSQDLFNECLDLQPSFLTDSSLQ